MCVCIYIYILCMYVYIYIQLSIAKSPQLLEDMTQASLRVPTLHLAVKVGFFTSKISPKGGPNKLVYSYRMGPPVDSVQLVYKC